MLKRKKYKIKKKFYLSNVDFLVAGLGQLVQKILSHGVLIAVLDEEIL